MISNEQEINTEQSEDMATSRLIIDEDRCNDINYRQCTQQCGAAATDYNVPVSLHLSTIYRDSAGGRLR